MHRRSWLIFRLVLYNEQHYLSLRRRLVTYTWFIQAKALHIAPRASWLWRSLVSNLLSLEQLPSYLPTFAIKKPLTPFLFTCVCTCVSTCVGCFIFRLICLVFLVAYVHSGCNTWKMSFNMAICCGFQMTSSWRVCAWGYFVLVRHVPPVRVPIMCLEGSYSRFSVSIDYVKGGRMWNVQGTIQIGWFLG